MDHFQQENAIAEYSANKPELYTEFSPSPDKQPVAACPLTSAMSPDTKAYEHESGPASFASFPARRYAPPAQEMPVAQVRGSLLSLINMRDC
eukprot:683142-Rhodomonas_salina.17